jgi:transcriptional regulator with XRE-family HTH domain
MIRNEAEYKGTLEQVELQRKSVQELEANLREHGLQAEDIQRASAPVRSFLKQLEEELSEYGRLKRLDLGMFTNIRQIGQLVIGARIAAGLSQRELSQRLGSSESQVSRDERNDYHGITVDRLWRVLEALGLEVGIQARFQAGALVGSPETSGTWQEGAFPQGVISKVSPNVPVTRSCFITWNPSQEQWLSRPSNNLDSSQGVPNKPDPNTRVAA